MERISKRRARAKSNQLTIGDKVTIANRFFANHGIKRHLIGEGKVLLAAHLFIRVEFKYHHIFTYCKANGFIISLTVPEKDVAVVEIHPVYLEKVK